MIDLKTAYGKTYRITLDESAEIDGQTREERLWLYQIPCKYGHIHVHGTDTLGGYASGRLIAGRLAALPGVRVHQRGDTEVAVVFTPNLLPDVAKLLKAYKRRHLTPERAREGAERLARYHAERDLASGAKQNDSADDQDEPTAAG